MEKRIRIENTDLSLCPIGLGALGAGPKWDGAEADRMFDTYLELGGNVIDTARVYSDWIPGEIGRSERVVGDWILREGKRNEVVIITKGGHPKFTRPTDDLHISRMGAADMRYDLELSLRALHVDMIDIYLYHRDDLKQSVEEEIEVMETFRREGKIRYYGCSNWSAGRVLEADAYCRAKGYRGFVADEAMLNIGMRHMEPLADDTLEFLQGNLYEYHRENLQNLAIPYTGVASGFFHAYLAKGEEAVKNTPYYTPENLKIAGKLKTLMEKYNATVSQVVLGYLYQQDFPCLALYGPHYLEQLKDAMGVLDISFEKEDYEEVTA